ncbi:hypothetical protein ACQKIC_13055 [Peribacillus sp. NPDC046944]|uniref:hypothetical protein n=1 Tax=unclassified Peribacillus TaxID=2675266 RepID=UPI00382B0557
MLGLVLVWVSSFKINKSLEGGMKMLTTLLCLIVLCGIELGLAYLAVKSQK